MPTTVALATLSATTVALTVFPHLVNDRFYFNDDLQHQYVPLFRRIGSALLEGKWPTLTLDSWLGGNILLDPQFALANPVSLASYVFLAHVDDFAIGILVLACGYSLITAIGAYRLARIHGATRELAIVAGVTTATLPMVSYWYAHSWISGLVGTAWCTVAWAAIAGYARERSGLLAVVVASWLTLTSGWPHATVALGIVACAEIGCLVFERRGPRAMYLVAAVTGAAMMAAPGVLPSLLLMSSTSRGSVGASGGYTSDLGALLQVSLPSFRAYTKHWYGTHAALPMPIHYVAWFLVALGPFLDWSRLKTLFATHRATVILALIALFLPLGPPSLGPLRWPMRFLPVFHTVVLVLWIAVLSTGGIVVSKRRVQIFLLLSLAQFVNATQVTPERFASHAVWTAALFAGALAVLAIRNRPVWRALSVLAITGAVCCAIHLQVPRNAAVGDFGLPRAASLMPEIPRISPLGYTFFVGKLGPDLAAPGRMAEFRTGNQFMLSESLSINGYSSLGNPSLQGRFCMNGFGETCVQAVAALFQTETETGRPWVDLMRIDRLILSNGEFVDAYDARENGTFRVVKIGRYSTWAERVRPLPGAGTVSHLPDHVILELDHAEATTERVHLRANEDFHGGAPVVFARLYWPGYEATINGQPAPVRAVDGILPAVDLPPGARVYEIVLRYRPPGAPASFVIAAIGVLVAAAAVAAARASSASEAVPGEALSGMTA